MSALNKNPAHGGNRGGARTQLDYSAIDSTPPILRALSIELALVFLTAAQLITETPLTADQVDRLLLAMQRLDGALVLAERRA